ncbi:DUF3085 domain-containing protein [Vibrio penaeicida]|uniref:DUF3085 domain-containing protein n=1 Tax=Vibrio penaeicida TaxID=104609 RepID=UPI001CC3D316
MQYAEGCDPKQNELEHGDWYVNARHIAGGDDFGEYLAVSVLLEVLKQDYWTKFVITITPTQMTISIS